MFLEIFKEYPALISLLAVAAGWFATRRGQIHGDRAKHSHSYQGILDKADYLKSLKLITSLLDKGISYREEEFSESERGKISQSIWDCLQVMEKAAIDIDLGYISEEYYYKKYRTLTERLFWVSHIYINKIRYEKNSSTIYKNFESLYIRTHFPRRPLTLIILEYITVCPNFRASSSIFAAHLRTIDKQFPYFVLEVFRRKSLPAKIDYIERDNKPLFNERITKLRILELIVASIFMDFTWIF